MGTALFKRLHTSGTLLDISKLCVSTMRHRVAPALRVVCVAICFLYQIVTYLTLAQSTPYGIHSRDFYVYIFLSL